ncbi:hypothetical protein [Parvibaculum sp.]|uniref:hypothetical protein n=1 Tax=Parvibaculum sp. TaxID=2024848 RepID=UPI002730D837|nr:hypothetical protein [Parvibaculum sp.]MDP1626941.1 hypothetical protein [Parvibaculum sp.]MDP2151663.1 hypothetical protein [Parvibaculum sp.]MDP3328952.1 hypothetical protein [Parvibaculum sp.]
MSDNVIELRLKSRPVNNQVEGNLFSHSKRYSGAFAIVKGNDLEQTHFENIVKIWNVSAVVDMRLLPAFRPPRFNSRRTSRFFIQNKIAYFDFSYIALDLKKGRDLQGRDIDMRKLGQLKGFSRFGLSLVLVDDDQFQLIAPFVRHFLSSLRIEPVEINPRALG